MKSHSHGPAWTLRAAVSLTAVALLVVACGGPDGNSPTVASTSAPRDEATPIPADAVQLLRTVPETGPVGTSVTVTGEGLPAGKTAELIWVTVEGTYDVEASSENVIYTDRKFTQKRVSLGSTSTDAEGGVTFEFSAPEDYGELHDLYVTVDGQDVAKGGFQLLRTVTMSPEAGPLGTLITIKMTALGSSPFDNTSALLYDNKNTGFISATTTRGTAEAQIRAAGPIGKHYVTVNIASHAQPYLNVEQSPKRHLGEFRAVFEVTEDAGPPAARLDWPDPGAVVRDGTIPRTAMGSVLNAPGVSADLSPSSGPILSKATLQASGLPPDIAVDLLWTTAKGNRVSPSGWELVKDPIATAKTTEDGSLSASIEVPEGLGGWHALAVVQDGTTLFEVPYFVERSLADVSPISLKAGETFTVQIKGIGWTELDNGVAVTYDNAYLGYACGFNSNGDITIYLQATGGPGTHLIDVYPMIYDGGHGLWPWQYDIPQLTFARDHPGLALGYNLPAFRLAVEVVE